MRLLVIYDDKIQQKDLKHVTSEVSKHYQKWADITPKWHFESRNYRDTVFNGHNPSIYDTLPYSYLKKETQLIYERWEEEIDHVVYLVHRDHWGGGHIWGENFSNLFNGYQVQVCRFDNQNLANSVGTLHHENHHSHDALIELILNIRIENLVGVSDWDNDVTHGDADQYDYIRYLENGESLQAIAPLLQEAYKKRRAVFTKKVENLQRQIIKLLQQKIVLLRQLKRQQRVGATRKCSLTPDSE